jgi:uncharacterized membrane protein YozB (DUF420 family)
MSFSFGFPELNASLNALCAILLCLGFCFIKAGKWKAHGWTMASATVVSAIFLACYLTYHILHGEKSTHLSHAPHWLRDIYLSILFPHLLLAVIMLPMIAATLWRANKRNWPAHRKMARPTLWIWLYVSVTGVIVHLRLYHTALNS